jgi:hypothetical protein
MEAVGLERRAAMEGKINDAAPKLPHVMRTVDEMSIGLAYVLDYPNRFWLIFLDPRICSSAKAQCSVEEIKARIKEVSPKSTIIIMEADKDAQFPNGDLLHLVEKYARPLPE